jgi:hypothetical protein
MYLQFSPMRNYVVERRLSGSTSVYLRDAMNNRQIPAIAKRETAICHSQDEIFQISQRKLLPD